MPVPIHSQLLRRVIEKRCGSIDRLVVDWEDRVSTGRQCSGEARDRATVYRWLKHGIPSKVNDLFGLCGVLDIDPLSLLPIDREFIEKEFVRERIRFQINQSRSSNLKPFDTIFLPGTQWPGNQMAECFYGRPWQIEDFEHDPSYISGVYAALELTIASDQSAPVVFHFAWRRSSALDCLWRPYGSVVRYEDRILLVSESGDLQTIDIESDSAPIVVETYFGAGAAMFRIACLHKFELSIQLPSQAKHAVRFIA